MAGVPRKAATAALVVRAAATAAAVAAAEEAIAVAAEDAAGSRVKTIESPPGSPANLAGKQSGSSSVFRAVRWPGGDPFLTSNKGDL